MAGEHRQLLICQDGGRSEDGSTTGYQTFHNHALDLNEPIADYDTETNFIEERAELNGRQTYNEFCHDNSRRTLVDRNKHLNGEEIIFRLKYAQMNERTDWVAELGHVDMETQKQVLKTLREQPLNIVEKLRISRHLREHLDPKSESKSSTPRTRRRMARHKSTFSLHSGIWEGSITKVSGTLGSHVASYFVFLRFLIYMDFLLALLTVGLVTLPQVLSGDNGAPQNLTGDFGLLSSSVAFYGAYSNTKWGPYDRPLAYLLTWSGVNIMCFIIIVASMYIRYSFSKQSDTGGGQFPFAWRVLSSWDYTLQAKEKGAKFRRQAIVTSLKEMTSEDRSESERMDCCKLSCIILLRVLVNTFVLGMLALSGYLIFLVANLPVKDLKIPDWFSDFVQTYKLPLVVSALKLLVPLVFEQIIRLEQWHPRTEIKITIARTALFYLASIAVLLLSLYEVSTKCNRHHSASLPTNESRHEFCCWENQVGEEIFKVILTDVGVTFLTALIMDIVRKIVHNRWEKVGLREFGVTSEVLNVIYGQSLIWYGLFFSPLLAALGWIKLVLHFHFHYVTATWCNVSSKRVFRASRSGNFFMFILLVNFFVCLVTMTFAIMRLQPSEDCGPFRDDDHIYDVIIFRIGNMPQWLNDILEFESYTTCGYVEYGEVNERDLAVFITTLRIPFMIFRLAVLFYKAKSSSYGKVINNLRQQLKFERRDEKKNVYAKARIVQGPGVIKAGPTTKLR